jgi:hypothetical protein
VFAKVKEVWDRMIFHDCPGLAVLARDFAARLAVSVARLAAKKKEAALKALEIKSRKGKERAINGAAFGGGFNDLDGQDSVAAAPPPPPPRTNHTDLILKQ